MDYLLSRESYARETSNLSLKLGRSFNMLSLHIDSAPLYGEQDKFEHRLR